MQEKWKKYGIWVEWLLSIAAIAYLVYRLVEYKDYDALTTLIDWQDWSVCAGLTMALLLVPVQLLVEVAKWRFALRGWKTITMRESWREVLLGQMAGFITPYRSGDIPARLVASGLPISKEEYSTRWRQWIKDWNKWFAVVGYSLLRHVVWGIQLWAVLTVVGIDLPLWQGIGSIVLYYVVISIMPILPVAEIPIKGGWAVAIFGQYSDNVAAILLAVSLIWFFNTILPVLFGSMKKFLYFCTQIRFTNSPIHRFTN